MKKYILDFLYIGSIILALILIFSNVSFPQSNVMTKPGQVIKLTWTPSEPDVFQYAVFYCQGVDTTQFPFNTGTDPDSLWSGNEPVSDWTWATVYDRKFALEPQKVAGITYLRLGVSAINQAGQYGLIKCIPKVITIKKPLSVIDVKTY